VKVLGSSKKKLALPFKKKDEEKRGWGDGETQGGDSGGQSATFKRAVNNGEGRSVEADED